MPAGDRDAARLWDMLTYAREISAGVSTLTMDEYLRDADRRLATERRLEIIGEAARGVSGEFQALHPEIPWRQIVGLRHILAHEYGDIKQDRIYRVVREHIPALVRMLEPLVPLLREG